MLPATDRTMVVRTDFADQDAWAAVRAAVDNPPGGDLVFASFTHVDDPAHAGLDAGRVVELVPADPFHAIVVLADAATMSAPELPLLVVDLAEEPGRTFRSVPEVLWHVANNLSVGNGYFGDYAERVDDDGVYRCGGRAGQLKVLTAIAELKGVPFDAATFGGK